MSQLVLGILNDRLKAFLGIVSGISREVAGEISKYSVFPPVKCIVSGVCLTRGLCERITAIDLSVSINAENSTLELDDWVDKIGLDFLIDPKVCVNSSDGLYSVDVFFLLLIGSVWLLAGGLAWYPSSSS